MLRVAFRTLARHRGFTTVAVLSLGVAIALNTTMYSVLDAMLYPHIAARRPETVYFVRYYTGEAGARRGMPEGAFESALRGSTDQFEGITGFEPLFAFGIRKPVAENGGYFARVHGVLVRRDFFDFLGTPALAGRTFVPSDEREGQVPVVISDDLARRIFPVGSAVGHSFILDGIPHTVIGVVEKSGVFDPLNADVWLLPGPWQQVAPTLIRFRKRLGKAEMSAALDLAAARLALAAGVPPGSTRFMQGGYAVRRYDLGPFHYALFGAVLAVLLVACANIANLQLARGLARTRELAVRVAVGASRRQLIRLLLLESGLVAGLGLVSGVLLTFWGVYVVRATMPPVLEDIVIQPQVSWRMFVVAAFAALLCVLLVGLLPALRVSRVDPDTLLKSGAGTGRNREHRRRYGVMVVAQIGFALPVLIGSFVLLRSVAILHDDDYFTRIFGYDPLTLATSWLQVGDSVTPSVPLLRVDEEIRAHAHMVPGVSDATIVAYHKPERARAVRVILVDDPDGSVREIAAAQWSYTAVSPTYMRIFGKRIIRGRDFDENDVEHPGIIIDSATAWFLWRHSNPIGRAMKLGDALSKAPWLRVVGVAADFRDSAAIHRSDPYAGYHLGDVYRAVSVLDTAQLVQLFARVHGSVDLAAVRLQRELTGLRFLGTPTVEPAQSGQYGIRTWQARTDFVASLFTTFAFIGVCLVAIGIAGIVMHSVVERRRELAVRISLGAATRDVLHTVLREGNALILFGTAIGLELTRRTVWWLYQFLQDENATYDSLGFALVAAGLFAVAVFSALVPAWRATQINPVEALRHE